jgi:hypothetical protein
LFKRCLREPVWVCCVVEVGAVTDDGSCMCDNFGVDGAVSSDTELVGPFVFSGVGTDFKSDQHFLFGSTPSDASYPSPPRERMLKSPSDIADLPDESYRIKEAGFPCSVPSFDTSDVFSDHVDVLDTAPPFKKDSLNAE